MRLSARLAWAAYDLLLEPVTWLGLAPWELLAGGGSAALRERLGAAPELAPGRPRILLHAVSAGEMRSAGALLPELRRLVEGVSFVLSTGNADGRAVAERLRAEHREVEAVVSLPWDRRHALLGWLGRLAPAALVVVETELWPNLFRTSRDLGIPLALASARVFPRDVPRYRRARFLFREVLACASWIGAQSEAERARLLSIGACPAAVEVAGSLKLDALAPAAPLPGPWARSLFAGVPVVVGGSTHAGEEALLLKALESVRRERIGVRLVLAPRHVRRARGVLRLVARASLRGVLWSEPARAAEPWEVLVVDEMGWLPTLYTAADISVVGGSFVRRGGQNLVEPAAAGRPVLAGPHLLHFREVADGLEAAGGLRIVPADPIALSIQLLSLLRSHEEARRMGERARAWCDAGRGAARRTAEVIASRMRSRGGGTPPREAPGSRP